jgi:hypothetical protein
MPFPLSLVLQPPIFLLSPYAFIPLSVQVYYASKNFTGIYFQECIP